MSFGLIALAGELAELVGAATRPCASLAPSDATLSDGPPSATDATINVKPPGMLRPAALFVTSPMLPNALAARGVLRRCERVEGRMRALAAAGIEPTDFGCFVNRVVPSVIEPSTFDQERATPIIIEWLPRVRNARVKEAIVGH